MTFDKVKEIIVATIKCEADLVTPEANLIDDLGIDSLDIVELNLAIEDALGITIDDDQMAELKTVADIVALVDAQQ